MKNKITIFLLLALVIVLQNCGSAVTPGSVSVDDDYGYSEKNPVKVGGVVSGPANERRYLDRLTGPNGEKVTYVRLGSCCAFDTSKGIGGMGLLDKYQVTIEGTGEKKILYLNMYDEDKLYAPKGFLLK